MCECLVFSNVDHQGETKPGSQHEGKRQTRRQVCNDFDDVKRLDHAQSDRQSSVLCRSRGCTRSIDQQDSCC